VDEIVAHVSNDGLYLPPEFRTALPAPSPPHTIISFPVITTLWYLLAEGQLPEVDVADHSCNVKLYCPPLLNGTSPAPEPPQTIKCEVVGSKTAVANLLASGTVPIEDTEVHVSVDGS